MTNSLKKSIEIVTDKPSRYSITQITQFIQLRKAHPIPTNPVCIPRFLSSRHFTSNEILKYCFIHREKNCIKRRKKKKEVFSRKTVNTKDRSFYLTNLLDAMS